MVKVNIHQHQKGKPNLSKKIFGPEATLIQCIILYYFWEWSIYYLKIKFCHSSLDNFPKFSFTENFYSETKIRKFPHCVGDSSVCKFQNHSVEIIEIYSYTVLAKFREINVFSKEITKELIWRNFFTVRVRILLSMSHQHFFRQINVFTKELSKGWFHGNFWAWSRFLILFHTVMVVKEPISNTKALIWRIFLPSVCFSFSTLCCRKYLYFPHCEGIY